MTEQGIANIRKAHAEQVKRRPNKAPVPAKQQRIRGMRKAEIIRMTNEGMSAEQIAENLQARGVTFKAGAKTVERFRTVWGLIPESQRNLENLRQSYRGQAAKLQREQFENIAAELGIEDVKAWVKSKMDEEGALEARREHAYRLMGPIRPKPVEPNTMRAIMKHWRKTKAMNRTQSHGAGPEGIQPPDQAMSAQPETPPQPGAAYDPIELSDDDLDSGSDEDVDCEGDVEHEAPAEDVGPQLSPTAVKAEHPESCPSQANSTHSSSHHPFQPPTAYHDHPFNSSNRTQDALPHPPVPTVTIDPNVPGGLIYPQYWTDPKVEERKPRLDGTGQLQAAEAAEAVQSAQSAQAEEQQPRGQEYSFSPVAGDPFEPPAQDCVEPRPLGPATRHRRRCSLDWVQNPLQGPSNYRPIAAQPAAAPAPAPIVRQFVPNLPPVVTPPGEAEMMARYGLYPFATFRRSPKKYLTPSGLVITEGYEYLPYAPGLPGIPGSMSDAPVVGATPAHQQQHQLTPDVIMVPAPAPPRPSDVSAPPVVIPPEEAEGHRASHDAIGKQQKAALECMEYLAARADGRPLSGSLTGLPPSLRDVDAAKGRLREAAEAMLASL